MVSVYSRVEILTHRNYWYFFEIQIICRPIRHEFHQLKLIVSDMLLVNVRYWGWTFKSPELKPVFDWFNEIKGQK